MPNEILLNVMDYLLGSELKSAALVSRRISQVAIPALYRRQTIVIGDREDDIKLASLLATSLSIMLTRYL